MRFINMIFQVRLFRKAFPAGPAVIRQIIGVGVHVELQIRHLIKSSIALVTAEGFLSRVNHYVIAQIAFLVKPFAADVADESFLVAVRPKVSLQRGAAIETLAAFVAFVWFFLGVNDLVPAQSAGQAKPLSAHVADKRSALSVIGHFQVNRQSVLGFENLATLIAPVDSLFRAIFRACTICLICFIQMKVFFIRRR